MRLKKDLDEIPGDGPKQRIQNDLRVFIKIQDLYSLHSQNNHHPSGPSKQTEHPDRPHLMEIKILPSSVVEELPKKDHGENDGLHDSHVDHEEDRGPACKHVTELYLQEIDREVEDDSVDMDYAHDGAVFYLVLYCPILVCCDQAMEEVMGEKRDQAVDFIFESKLELGEQGTEVENQRCYFKYK